VTTFDLRSVRIRSGEEHREAREIDLPALELGGQRYVPVPEKIEAEFVVTRASTGTVLQLRFPARLHGPTCGRDLNVEPHVHEETATDPRWAALETLREKL